MDQTRDIYSLLKRIIYNETLYLRHWLGKVIDDQDPSKRGRVKVTVGDLGFLQDGQALWCSPRQGYSVTPPTQGEWVEVYFMGGDQRRPVYLVGAGEVTGNMPAAFTDPKTTRVIWQDTKNGDSLVYNQTDQVYTLTVGKYAIVLDVKNKKTTLTCGGNVILMDDGNKKISLTAGGQTVVLDDNAGKVQINGTSLEVTP